MFKIMQVNVSKNNQNNLSILLRYCLNKIMQYFVGDCSKWFVDSSTWAETLVSLVNAHLVGQAGQ